MRSRGDYPNGIALSGSVGGCYFDATGMPSAVWVETGMEICQKLCFPICLLLYVLATSCIYMHARLDHTLLAPSDYLGCHYAL